MDETLIRTAIRATARTSFVLFLCAFLSGALYRLWPAATTRWLKEKQDRFTLGFAASHAVHLAFILTLVANWGTRTVIGRGWVVFIAFVTGLPLHLCSGPCRPAARSRILAFFTALRG